MDHGQLYKIQNGKKPFLTLTVLRDKGTKEARVKSGHLNIDRALEQYNRSLNHVSNVSTTSSQMELRSANIISVTLI